MSLAASAIIVLKMVDKKLIFIFHLFYKLYITRNLKTIKYLLAEKKYEKPFV